MKAVFLNTSAPDERRNGYKMALVFKSVHGMTADQLHDRAQAMQASVEEAKNMEKTILESQQEKAKEQPQSALTQALKEMREKEAQRAKTDAELVAKKSPEAVKNRAIEEIRRAAATRFGADVATDASITANLTDVKVLGGDNWEVTGHLSGPGKPGEALDVNWVMRIRFQLNELVCVSQDFDNPRPRAGRNTGSASKKPSMAPSNKTAAKPKTKPQ